MLREQRGTTMIWSDIEGYFGPEDAAFVSDICSQILDGIIVELGVFAGRSTAVMAPICRQNNNQYHAIDNFCGGGNPPDRATRHQRNRNIRALFDANMTEMELLSFINVHKLDSAESASMFQDNIVDFCFIDADHTAVAIQKDIDAWWPKIRINGFLGGHDYPSPPLQTVVQQFAMINQVQIMVRGRCWVVRKKQ